jgi:PAS domain S-box-containing protein
MGFSAPVFPGLGAIDAGRPPGQLPGIVLLVSDVSQTLFPLVVRQGAPTRTGETILVRREGNEVVFFSPLRHVPAGSPHLRFPLSAAPIPARLALEGRETFVEYNDYRGVPVLAATRHIPLTGWGLVRKIDRAEAMGDFRGMASREELAAGLLIILLGGLLLFHRRDVLTRGLKQEEEKFRMLLEWAPDAIYIIQPSTLRIVRRNRKAAEMDGYSDEDLTHMTAADLYPPEYHTLLRERFEKGLETGRTFPIQTLHHRRKDGQLVSVEESQSLVEAGGEGLVLSIVRDISGRKQAEEELRRANAYNRSLIEASLDPLVTISTEGKVTDVNTATERVTGLLRQELVGTDFSDYFTDAEKARAGYQRVFREGWVQDYELEVQHRNGQVTPVLYNASLYRDEAGTVVGVFAAARDISERQRAEEEIRELNANLERHVTRRTAELEAANKELEAFTYSVSHDLRAPLRHIDGFSKLLSEEHATALPPEAKEYVSIIRDSVLQMGTLIDDLLNLARVGRTQLSMQVTGLDSLVEEVRADLKRSNPDRLIEWKVQTLPFVECDPGLMKQVFANLLSNAVKFTRPRKPAVIEVGVVRQDDHPAVFVRDNGVGFSMKYANKLFGVFQRLHRAEDFEGTGVGLATVQRIIHKHRGRVWAEAELDKGATFYFTLGSSDDPQPEKPTDSGGNP